jgi:DNA-binding CsgD family transcriptional regulator
MRADHAHPWPDRLIASIRRAEVRPLSEREVRALMLASYGMEIAECAELMGVSRCAVHSYWRQARRKLRAKNTTHAVALAIRAGLIV